MAEFYTLSTFQEIHWYLCGVLIGQEGVILNLPDTFHKLP